MWDIISWRDHIPSVEISLHVASFVEGSAYVNTCASGSLKIHPLQSSRFCIDHFNSVSNCHLR